MLEKKRCFQKKKKRQNIYNKTLGEEAEAPSAALWLKGQLLLLAGGGQHLEWSVCLGRAALQAEGCVCVQKCILLSSWKCVSGVTGCMINSVCLFLQRRSSEVAVTGGLSWNSFLLKICYKAASPVTCYCLAARRAESAVNGYSESSSIDKGKCGIWTDHFFLLRMSNKCYCFWFLALMLTLLLLPWHLKFWERWDVKISRLPSEQCLTSLLKCAGCVPCSAPPSCRNTFRWAEQM